VRVGTYLEYNALIDSLERYLKHRSGLGSTRFMSTSFASSLRMLGELSRFHYVFLPNVIPTAEPIGLW
jgi:hypothetical protein